MWLPEAICNIVQTPSRYEKRLECRNDPNYKGCAKHMPANGPQALHTDEECFEHPKNTEKKKAPLEKNVGQHLWGDL
jgi:hypothetical protein